MKQHLTLIHAKLMREWYAVVGETDSHFICKPWGRGPTERIGQHLRTGHTFQCQVGFLKRDVFNHTHYWTVKVINR